MKEQKIYEIRAVEERAGNYQPLIVLAVLYEKETEKRRNPDVPARRRNDQKNEKRKDNC